jgi:uncharacterized membrane protein (DUF4010 family)
VRRPAADLDGTTEVAAIAVLGLASLAGLGWLTLASSSGAIVVLALSEKRRLHHLVSMLGRTELSAALQFTVLAVVILPLLPTGPILGPLAVRPRALWAIVLAFCAVNFASFVARRAGAERGYGIVGALGGLLSSTAVTLAFAQRSRAPNENGGALARGVVAACAVVVLRVLIISLALNPRVALVATPYLAPGLLLGSLLAIGGRAEKTFVDEPPDERSPLRLANALEMALAFQVGFSAIAVLRPLLGPAGLYGAAVGLGLANLDALTVAMSSPASLVNPVVAARALAIGVLASTVFKLAITIAVGAPRFRRRSAGGLASVAAVTAAALAVF